MALADPYEACPCGSGKKYKWCCQKAESYLERSVRLEETGQAEASLVPIEEGLAKLPGNALLLIRKALHLMSLERDEEAGRSLDLLLAKDPVNPVALDARARIFILNEGPVAAVPCLQNALRMADEGARRRLGELALLIGQSLARGGFSPAGLKHVELAATISDQEELVIEANRLLDQLRKSPDISPWLKQPLVLSPAPASLDAAGAQAFQQALAWARDGLWDAAAAAFELLSANPSASPIADRNLGICRLWLADEDAAVGALRRFIAGSPPTTEAVDLAIIIELIDPAKDPEQVEEVSLSWPLRDRSDLLRRLDEHATVVREPTTEPEEREEGEQLEEFLLLDRSNPETLTGLTPGNVPRVLAEISVGRDDVKLVVIDDGRLNAVMDQFTAIARTSIPPSHPRTKVTNRLDRSDLAWDWRWYLPQDLDEAERDRLVREQSARFIVEQWPEVPQATFGGKSPAHLAKSGNAQVLLRAALLRLETDYSRAAVDWAALRTRLNVPAEPAIDPTTVVIEDVPPGRLALVPLEGLDDTRLVSLQQRAAQFGAAATALASSKEIVRRGTPISEGKIRALAVYPILITEAVGKNDRAAAFDLLQTGRASSRAMDDGSASAWDLTEFQLSVRFDAPEAWVPLLLELTARYQDDAGFSQAISSLLIRIGLLRLVPLRDRPGEYATDTRVLERLVSLYGPKVQTATDYLGISATKGEIWTPASENKGASAIWTPGSGAAGPEQGGDKPKIILAR